MKFIKFNDSQIDSFLFMELEDLARTLTKDEEMEIEYRVSSYYDPYLKKMYLSHFWGQRPHEETVAGLKSDVFLRSTEITHGDYGAIARYVKHIRRSPVQSFARQLFMVFENLRLEEDCKKDRPGTKKVFLKRREMYKMYFSTQLRFNVERNIHTDALFCALYVLATVDNPFEELPSIQPDIDRVIPFLREQIMRTFEAKTTREVTRICEEISDVLEEVLEKDMLNTYFLLPDFNYEELKQGLTFDDLKRKSKLKNDDVIKGEKSGEEDVHEDKLPTWHQETSKATESFLQFDLEQGSKTDLGGDDAVREGEDGDQALGVVQGQSKKAKRNDYSKLEALETRKEEPQEGGDESFGKDNRYAKALVKEKTRPTSEERSQYSANVKEIAPYQKRLKQMISKTLEHKRILPRTDLHFGRLNQKNLLRLATDDNPRLFHKKNDPSHEIDAVFSLLVDCSASMFDKMEQTKLGITLFHEALKSVHVPHEIVGFWEDTNDATETYQPNYFQHVIDFSSSYKKESGSEIMQLEPMEDNRDGFAIRHASQSLMKRSEKQKFLLVFSDGEPAAMGYEQNGVVDTHEAVLLARKQGIEVINVFLSNEPIDEGQQTTIRNIYGKYSILVEDVSELPNVLFPLLKRLLHKSIQTG
ncbi:VWA domain-containing protein [Priestia filamentosa]|uniref:vWA domain-containing protein n=1 Tax=Priestia filamentosa TaxID=1402861 RepID=UPI001FB29806|nr:VWA domain-containing protein [Priestia filamentosa]MED3726219.1 VWA domain-containing protein [Priestia filamentosa]UOE59331.1 VWA domain-containing protein [Priestia filamentosa]